MNPQQVKQAKTGLLIFVLVAVALEAIFFSLGNLNFEENLARQAERHNKNFTFIDAYVEENNMLAKAISVYNITQDEKVYGKNDSIPLPLASLAKTMTVLEALGANKGKFFTISTRALSQNGDYGLLGNEKWSVEDLAKLTLVASANDGAYALAESDEDFLEKLNIKVRKIGLEDTKYSNATGLDVALTPGALGTAEDANKIAIYARKAYPDIFSVTTTPEISLKSESGFVHTFENTNIAITKIPNLLFSKTGFTNSAGGNLSIIFKNKKGEEIAVTVLGSTYSGRFTDMEKLVNLLYSL